MRISTLCMATFLAVGAVGIAQATPNLVQNGDFSQTTPNHTMPTQFGGSSRTGFDANGSCTYGGQFVSNWKGTSGYELWYPSAAAASGVTACNQFNGATTQRLPALVEAPPVGPGSFIGLDGQEGIRAAVSQTVNGLTSGSSYTVNFYWGSTQEMSRSGETTEQFEVSLGGQSHKTSINTIPTHGWSGWAPASFTFTADSSTGSGWNVLNFLSIGTPGNLPPFAVLTGVSMTRNVPEPPELAMFGGGLLGLGLLIMAARRREMHRRDADGNRAIV